MTALGASISMVAGLLLSAYLHPAWLLGAAGIWTAFYRVVPFSCRQRFLIYVLIAILAGLYFYGYEISHRSSLQPLAEQERTVWVRATIESPVKRDGDAARFFAEIGQWGDQGGSWQPLSPVERVVLRVKLSTEKEAAQIEQWRIGDQLIAPIQLALPAIARNPHAFDYSRYLYWQGVHVVGAVEYRVVRVIDAGDGVRSHFQQWQDDAAKRIERLFANPTAAGYMKSLLLGLGEDVPVELESMYADLGLTHVLAISGLHVTLVSSLFMWTLERVGFRRKWALIATSCMLIGYVLLVGASSSAVRSGIMGGVGLACQVLNKRLDGKEVWAGTLLLMLLVNPYQLWHVGFQLSFAVTLGLIVYVPFSQQVCEWIPAWIRALVAVTITAQVVSFPFLVYHFHQFSPLSWLVNLVVTPILSAVVLPLGYIAILLGMLHPLLSSWPVLLSTQLLEWIHQPLLDLQKMAIPFSHWSHPPWWWLLIYGNFLIAVPILWKLGYHRRRDGNVVLALFFVMLVMARQPFFAEKEVRITFLDVGQGDSSVVEIGNKKVYLIDAGGTLQLPAREPWREKRDPFEVGKDVVLPFLRARGIETIDRVVMTHGDMDHIGGMDALVPRFSFGAVLVNGTSPEAKEQEALRLLQNKGVPILTGKQGISWSDAPGVEWTWLHPGQKSNHSGNDASVVLQLTAYGTTVLFTGDIEADGERQLVQSGLPAVDVLKVAHHGSHTSSSDAFLAATKPKTAVISLGLKNRYGHPSPEVLKRLQKTGTTVFRTDRHGAITLIIRPTGVTWKTQVSDT